MHHGSVHSVVSEQNHESELGPLGTSGTPAIGWETVDLSPWKLSRQREVSMLASSSGLSWGIGQKQDKKSQICRRIVSGTVTDRRNRAKWAL